MLPPTTRFSGTVSSHRVFEAVGLPLADFKTIRDQVGDVTVNDLFLAIVGGALRRYLESKDELPATSLVALMPISTRDDGRAIAGNQVGGVPVPVGSHIADPIARLHAVHAGAQAARRDAEALGRGFVQAAIDELPHAAAEFLARTCVYPQLNVTVSNVRGPEATLFVAGARLVHFYPLSIATDWIGLNHTGFSYNGVMWISAVACRNMMPDPGFYADCLRASYEELMTAIEALPAPLKAGAAARGAKSRAPARPAPAAKQGRATPARKPATRRTPARRPKAGTTASE
jgi:diacylglycerol O-acyltransferase